MKRRDFMKGSLAAAAALALPGCATGPKPFSRIRGANDDIRIGVIGLRIKGHHHVECLRELPGARVVAVCDADKSLLQQEVEQFKASHSPVDAYVDLRRLLDNPNVDAVVIATPNHWHALATIWACQAGKDVYVEKPVCHNVWEGRQMVRAARHYRRIVQTGTQKRSDPGIREAFDSIQKGDLGKILYARGICYKRRESIGKVDGPQPIPESVNYDLWCGPAPKGPLMRQQLHYDWHWVWPTGNGDIGNQGVHEVDMCRWALGQTGFPPRVFSLGGRFGYDDDGETPNTQLLVYDYSPAPILFEVRGLPRKKEDSAMDHYRGIRIGVVIQCEQGYFAGGEGGGWFYDNAGKHLKQFVGDGGAGHHANFLKAVRSRNPADLNADILEGYISSSLCHLGNISYRVGTETPREEIREAIKADREVLDSFQRFESHLAANEIDLERTRAALGPWLKFDSESERFVGGFNYPRANDLLTREYRPPFVVPERLA